MRLRSVSEGDLGEGGSGGGVAGGVLGLVFLGQLMTKTEQTPTHMATKRSPHSKSLNAGRVLYTQESSQDHDEVSSLRPQRVESPLATSNSMSVDFSILHEAQEYKQNPALYTTAKRLTEIRKALLEENWELCSLGEEVVYCVLLARWIEFTKENPAYSPGVEGLWFELPDGLEAQCVLSELYFRVYQAAQRMLALSCCEDQVVPGVAESETALPLSLRQTHQTLISRLIGLMRYLDKSEWPEAAATLPQMGLPDEYRSVLKRCLRAYGLWNAASIVALKLQATRRGEILAALPRAPDDYAMNTVADLDHDTHIEFKVEAGGSDDLSEHANMEVSASAGPRKVDLRAALHTSDMESEAIHILDRPSSRGTVDVREVLKVVNMLYTCRTLLSHLPENVDLAGCAPKRWLRVKPGTERLMLHNLSATKLIMDSSVRMGESLRGSSVRPVPMPWCEQAKVHFLVWLGRYFRLIQQEHNALSCHRAAVFNGALLPGMICQETAYSTAPLSTAIPATCFGLVGSVCVVQSKILEKGKDPLAA